MYEDYQEVFDIDTENDIPQEQFNAAHDILLCNLYGELLGYSEWFDLRVAEKITLKYRDTDIIDTFELL